MNSLNVTLTGIAVIICLVMCGSLMAAVSAPVCPTIFAGNSGGFEIYWFYPGRHEISAGYLLPNPEFVGSPSSDGGHYAIITRFGLRPPMVVNYAATYIANFNPFSNQSGDQYAPLTLFLGQPADNACFAYEQSFELALDSTLCESGEIVGVDDIGYSSIRHEIWVGLEWPERESTMPFVGATYYPVGLEQLILNMGETTCSSNETQLKYMLGLRLLSWAAIDGAEQKSEKMSGELSFEVLFTEDTLDSPTQYKVLDIVDDDSLYTAFDIENEGFICIRASDGVESAGSVWTVINPDRRPDIAIYPPILEMPRNKSAGNSYDFAVANTGLANLSIKLDYDSLLLRPNPQMMNLGPGETVVVGLELLAGAEADSLSNSTITILSSENKYPVLYHLEFLPAEPIGVSENHIELPDRFTVSEAYPDPFNGSVRFEIGPSEGNEINFEVFDILGRRVYHSDIAADNRLSLSWAGQDETGGNLASGVYLFRFSCGRNSIVKRAVLIK